MLLLDLLSNRLHVLDVLLHLLSLCLLPLLLLLLLFYLWRFALLLFVELLLLILVYKRDVVRVYLRINELRPLSQDLLHTREAQEKE